MCHRSLLTVLVHPRVLPRAPLKRKQVKMPLRKPCRNSRDVTAAKAVGPINVMQQGIPEVHAIVSRQFVELKLHFSANCLSCLAVVGKRV